MAARFTEPKEAEIVTLHEKATPENTKKQLHMDTRSRCNELIANSALRALLTISSCMTRAHGIVVKYGTGAQ